MSDGVLGLPAHTDREALANFIEGLRVSESAAKQMAFYTQRAEWVLIEGQLATIRETCVKLAQSSLSSRRLII